MAPRTPRRSLTAGPFVTLSLSKVTASRLSLGKTNGTPLTDSPPKSLPSEKDDESSSVKKKPRSGTKASHATQPAKSAMSSPLTNLGQTLDANTVTFLDFTTPSSTNNTNHDAAKTIDSTTESGGRSQNRLTKKEDYPPIYNPATRRSSTASLTDTITRVSNRARKLTTKAQALAGTNFLPSLQNTSDIESLSSPTNLTKSDEHMSHDALEERQAVPMHSPPEDFTEDAPAESVEAPTVRSSTRERKPSARAIELETVKTLRKRPASPMNSDRGSKIAKNSPSTLSKRSNLGHSAGEKDEMMSTPEVDTEAVKEVPLADDISQNTGKSAESSQSTTGVPVAPAPVVPASVVPTPVVQQGAKQVPQPPPKDEKPAPVSKWRVELPPCDFECLSPTGRLLAYARLAADWPDIYTGSTSSDERWAKEGGDWLVDCYITEEYNELMNTRRPQYCRCKEKGLDFSSRLLPPVRDYEYVSSDSGDYSEFFDELEKRREEERKKKKKPRKNPSQPKSQKPKPRSVKRPKPTPLRQSNSFEQQIPQPVGVDTTSGDHLRRPLVKTTYTNAANVEATPSIVMFSPQPIRFQVNGSPDEFNQPGMKAHPLSESSQVQEANQQTPKVDSQSCANTGTIKSNTRATESKPATNSGLIAVGEQTTAKPLSRTGKVGVRGGGRSSSGKSSAAGSVRRSLQDVPAPEKEKVVTQYQAIVPPKATSIKLRFTTSVKGGLNTSV